MAGFEVYINDKQAILVYMKFFKDRKSGVLLLVLMVLVLIVGWVSVNMYKSRSAENAIIAAKEEVRRTEMVVDGKTLYKYVKVTDGCAIHFEGECLLVRSGPGRDFEVVSRLRNDMVLQVEKSVEGDGLTWYKIKFDEHLFYPERLASEWYIAADYLEAFYDEGDKTTWENDYATSTKEIAVDLTEQKLTATENGEVFMRVDISSGLEDTPTPRGVFKVFKKTPSRYMQGPLPGSSSDQSYDLPGVPWNLYFTEDGAVIHGAYWHDSFGTEYSHGCVNLLPAEAQRLYEWAGLGTKVTVTD